MNITKLELLKETKMDMHKDTPVIVIGVFCIMMAIVFGIGCFVGWMLF